MNTQKLIQKLNPKTIFKIFKSSSSDEIVFDGDDTLFKSILRKTQNYGEYGCGKSTIWVCKHTFSNVVSVDSSQEWITHCQKLITRNQVILTWINLGPIGKWGTPISYEHRDRFMEYAESLWLNRQNFDTILIDGRFRVLCFLISLKNASEDTRILFDDYVNRPHYHIVEELLKPVEFCGRQALFIVPNKNQVDFTLLYHLINKFEYVMQ